MSGHFFSSSLRCIPPSLPLCAPLLREVSRHSIVMWGGSLLHSRSQFFQIRIFSGSVRLHLVSSFDLSLQLISIANFVALLLSYIMGIRYLVPRHWYLGGLLWRCGFTLLWLAFGRWYCAGQIEGILQRRRALAPRLGAICNCGHSLRKCEQNGRQAVRVVSDRQTHHVLMD